MIIIFPLKIAGTRGYSDKLLVVKKGDSLLLGDEVKFVAAVMSFVVSFLDE